MNMNGLKELYLGFEEGSVSSNDGKAGPMFSLGDGSLKPVSSVIISSIVGRVGDGAGGARG